MSPKKKKKKMMMTMMRQTYSTPGQSSVFMLFVPLGPSIFFPLHLSATSLSNTVHFPAPSKVRDAFPAYVQRCSLLTGGRNHAQLPGASDTAASFELVGEDHTLGNALRWVIMKK